MSVWEELKIDKLPEDIFVKGKYIFRVKFGNIWSGRDNALELITSILNGEIDHPVGYRKAEPKAQTHEQAAREWANKHFPEYEPHILTPDRPRQEVGVFEETIMKVKNDVAYTSYLQGRKSVDKSKTNSR